MSLWRPRLEYFSLTRLISAYSRRTFRVVPGQLEAFEGSWPPLLHVALAVAVAGCGWLSQPVAVAAVVAVAVAGCGWGWGVVGVRLLHIGPLCRNTDIAGDGASWACGCCT